MENTFGVAINSIELGGWYLDEMHRGLDRETAMHYVDRLNRLNPGLAQLAQVIDSDTENWIRI